MLSVKNITIKIIKDYSKRNGNIQIQGKNTKNYVSEPTSRDKENSSNLYKDCSNKISIKSLIEKHWSSSKSVKKFVNKTIDNKTVNNLSSDDVNREINLSGDVRTNKNVFTNIDKNNDKNLVNSITKDVNMNKNLKNKTSICSPIKVRNSLISATTASFGIGFKKIDNLDQNQNTTFCGINDNKKTSSVANSGIYSFCAKKITPEKKSDLSINEKIENKSEYAYSSNNQLSKSSKEITISNRSAAIKRSTQIRNSIMTTISSIKENNHKNKLGNVIK